MNINSLQKEEKSNNNSSSAKIYQQQVVNPSKLLIKIKELIKSEQYPLAKLYLFLMKLSNKSNNFGVKIKIIYFLSEIAFKEKNEKNSIRFGHKIISWINNLDIKTFNEEVIICFIQVLINSSEICENNFIMFSCWFLFVAKNLCMEKLIKIEYINEKIQTKFPSIIKKLKEKLNDIKDDLLDKKNNILRLADELKKYLKNKNNETIYKNLKIGQKFYIINKNWVNNFLNFVNKITPLNKYKNEKELDSIFDVNSLFLSYFSEDNINKEDMIGIYCGKINNINFIKLKNYWADNQDEYTNIFVNKKFFDKSKNENYLLIEEDIYNKLKYLMGINYEIKRIKTKEENILFDDINLYPIKILFLNEEIRDKQKDQIIIKYIQMNKFCDIKDLIEKIKRVFINFLKENKYNINEYEYKIYISEYNQKETINLLLNYINISKNYKIEGQLINTEFITKNNIAKLNLEEFLKNKYICCEVINKNSIVIPFLILYNKSKIFCPTCNITLDLTNSQKKFYPCGFCSQNIYCSEKCRVNDSNHIQFHSYLSNLCDNSFKASDIQEIKIESFLDKNSRNGLVGLTNNGENDYLLSCIQALSSCEILTKFILTQSNKYLNETYISKDKNSFISCYTELINKMWVGNNPVVNPSKFTELFFTHINKLKLENIDALDALTFLLDKLHEELNEYKNKKSDNIDFYYQLINESDKNASNRWIKAYKSMNESIIIDLFYGQLKQIIICPYCNCEFISYPFFSCLNLPIPNPKNDIKSIFRVFPYSNNLFNYAEISYYDINKMTSILNIKDKIKQYKMFSKTNLEALLYENNEFVEILPDDTLVYDYVFSRYNFSDENFIDYEITFIEKPEEKHNNIYIYTTPVIFEEEKKLFYTKMNIIALTYCKLFCFNNESTIYDLEKEIFKYYRRAIDNKYKVDTQNNVDDSYYIEFYQKLSDEEYINEEFENYNKENESLKIYIYHNLPKEDGWIFSGPRCEFCGYTACQKNFCKMDLIKNMKIQEIKKKLKIDRPIILLIDFKNYEHMFSIFYQPIIDKTDPRMYLKEEINIYDCFEIFSKSKKLKNEKNYICEQCNKKVIPSQIKFPYISPKYLIISFNRIKKEFEDFFEKINSKKDETPIGYPIDNLDISQYFISDDNSNNQNLYNLIVVILHFGDIKKAKYKTYVRKRELWYEMKDKEYKKINSDEVISKNAYILIYEKKDNLIGLKEKFEEDKNNFDINVNDLNIENTNDINNMYNKEYDENFPLKKNRKIYGEMKDI